MRTTKGAGSAPLAPIHPIIQRSPFFLAQSSLGVVKASNHSTMPQFTPIDPVIMLITVKRISLGPAP